MFIKSFNSLIFILCSTFAFSQVNDLNVYLNCQNARCYTDYLKAELPMFNFVRDQATADVLVLITDNGNASGGANYTIYFEGQNSFRTQLDTTRFSTRADATEDIRRKKVLNAVSLGLLGYLKSIESADLVKVTFNKTEQKKTELKKDKWNSWIFGVGGNGRFSGESNRSNVSFDGNIRGGRTTHKSKFSFYSYYNNRTNSVVVDSVTNTVKVNDYGFNSLFVAAFNNHWSLGGFVKGYHSVYQNIKFSKSIAPALEYSVFPVQEFNRKQLRWIYQAGIRDFDYIELTVFDKVEETLPYQQITGILGFTQNWGNFSAELSGYQYLNNLERYRLSLEIDLSLRVAQGLSLRFYGNGSQINNQISLPKSSGDAANVLLGGRQLATTFSYLTSFGLNYTFGSINNSIVNPRFSGVN
ncbi:hypothetical protein EGI22_20280 [Lacihabitans sp. LS3-19]|uniref:DUF481 domain-containing protein n=1 Tax=Lacihabitans sp. LS3-19 TaxID=2487335 RepID=UPI0020CF0C74|nr:DUF481 domain-containing protein [Lacihabitans sp. LS3-19]MCP9770249.1 hypothetical protein [Lacihabitans sp. LS3-19]